MRHQSSCSCPAVVWAAALQLLMTRFVAAEPTLGDLAFGQQTVFLSHEEFPLATEWKAVEREVWTQESNWEEELALEGSQLNASEGGASRRKLQACNYNEGSWVNDKTRPSYSHNCQFIRSAFNCRANGRPDHAYEMWSWKPKTCHQERFNVDYFLSKLRGKIIGIIGDSFNKNFGESLACELSRKVRVQLYSSYVHGTHVLGVWLPDSNTRIITIDAPYIVQWSNHSSDFAKYGLTQQFEDDYIVWLDRMDPLWRQVFKYVDLTIFMSGHWFLVDQGPQQVRHRFFIHKGKLLPEITSLHAYSLALSHVKEYVLKTTQYKGVPMWLSYTPSHYTEGSPPYCKARRPFGNKAARNFYKEDPDQSTSFRNLEFKLLGGTRFRLIDITFISDWRHDAHVETYFGKPSASKTTYDCTHWCLPGVPDIWTDVFQHVLKTQLHR